MIALKIDLLTETATKQIIYKITKEKVERVPYFGIQEATDLVTDAIVIETHSAIEDALTEDL